MSKLLLIAPRWRFSYWLEPFLFLFFYGFIPVSVSIFYCFLFIIIAKWRWYLWNKNRKPQDNVCRVVLNVVPSLTFYSVVVSNVNNIQNVFFYHFVSPTNLWNVGAPLGRPDAKPPPPWCGSAPFPWSRCPKFDKDKGAPALISGTVTAILAGFGIVEDIDVEGKHWNGTFSETFEAGALNER